MEARKGAAKDGRHGSTKKLEGAFSPAVPPSASLSAFGTIVFIPYLYDLLKIPAHSSSDISHGFARNNPPIVSLAFTASVMDSSGLMP